MNDQERHDLKNLSDLDLLVKYGGDKLQALRAEKDRLEGKSPSQVISSSTNAESGSIDRIRAIHFPFFILAFILIGMSITDAAVRGGFSNHDDIVIFALLGLFSFLFAIFQYNTVLEVKGGFVRFQSPLDVSKVSEADIRYIFAGRGGNLKDGSTLYFSTTSGSSIVRRDSPDYAGSKVPETMPPGARVPSYAIIFGTSAFAGFIKRLVKRHPSIHVESNVLDE